MRDSLSILGLAGLLLVLPAAYCGSQAQSAPASAEGLRTYVLTDHPATTVAKVDKDRLSVHRIDIVDGNGVIRMTLSAPTPEPIVDGIQYRRSMPASGLVIFDKEGSERGGLVIQDTPGGVPALAMDHANADAIGWRVMPDGSVSLIMNQRPPLTRVSEFGDRLLPGQPTATRITLNVASDGQPTVALADKNDRPRVRLTVTPEGYGAIEFLDAGGNVVDTIAPEARRRPTRRKHK